MRKAFLITPFNPERAGNEAPALFRRVQNIVANAVAAAGLSLVHPAGINAAGVIIEQVREALMEADVVLAILTGQNANVFYELGIALEKARRPAILIVRSKDDIPFDVRHHRYLTYDGEEELQHLQRSLERAIRETLSRPSTTGISGSPFGSEISSLIARAHSKSKCVAEALDIARRLNRSTLYGFCVSELKGWGAEALRQYANERPGYRFMELFASPTHQVNSQSLGFGNSPSSVLDYLRRDKEHFTPVRMLFPHPLSEVENKAVFDPSDSILQITLWRSPEMTHPCSA
jgi:hypothetical protein